MRIVGEEGDLGSDMDAEDAAVMQSLSTFLPDLKCLDNKWKSDTDLSVPAQELCVYIDPLDGTREFTEGRFNFVSTLGDRNCLERNPPQSPVAHKSPAAFFPH